MAIDPGESVTHATNYVTGDSAYNGRGLGLAYYVHACARVGSERLTSASVLFCVHGVTVAQRPPKPFVGVRILVDALVIRGMGLHGVAV